MLVLNFSFFLSLLFISVSSYSQKEKQRVYGCLLLYKERKVHQRKVIDSLVSKLGKVIPNAEQKIFNSNTSGKILTTITLDKNYSFAYIVTSNNAKGDDRYVYVELNNVILEIPQTEDKLTKLDGEIKQNNEIQEVLQTIQKARSKDHPRHLITLSTMLGSISMKL